MSKPKFTPEQKIAIIKRYLSGEESSKGLATAHGLGTTTIKGWIRRYQEQGDAGFFRDPSNVHYSTEFKIQCVEAVLRGEGSVESIAVKYNISSTSVLNRWIMKYNANMELKNYEPKREVYMAEARRKKRLLHDRSPPVHHGKQQDRRWLRHCGDGDTAASRRGRLQVHRLFSECRLCPLPQKCWG